METFSALLALCAGIHRSPVNSPNKGQWRGALMISLICAWINDWVKNLWAGDLRRHRAHYNVTVMYRCKHGIDCQTVSIWNRYKSNVIEKICQIILYIKYGQGAPTANRYKLNEIETSSRLLLYTLRRLPRKKLGLYKPNEIETYLTHFCCTHCADWQKARIVQMK